MSVPDENLTKYTLLVQRSPQALVDYYTMDFPPPTSFTHQTKHARESRCVYGKNTKYYQPFFYERETKYL